MEVVTMPQVSDWYEHNFFGYGGDPNIVVYTAGPVACDWAGAIKPESAENAENAEKA